MASIPELAYEEARKRGLDLRVSNSMVSTAIFPFECLEPKESVIGVFRAAKESGDPWVSGMPLPVLVYYPERNEFRIMDGMLRICAAQRAGMKEFPALVASGETYDALEPILDHGYYGEDFVEMLAMVSDEVRDNLELRNKNRLSGVR